MVEEPTYPVYCRHLVEMATGAQEPVTEVDDTGSRVHYRAVQERDGKVWFVEITDGEYYDEPNVAFRRSVPDSEAEILRKWTSLATGRLSGPQQLPAWEAIFTVFNAALGLYQKEAM
jgi:hypothetical protein